MTLRILAVLLLVAPLSITADDRSNAFAEVRKYVPRAKLAPANLAASLLAGHYSDHGPETERRAGPALTGSELYLFADGSYLATQWGCLLPETISDRGAWSYAGGVVALESDGSVPQGHSSTDRQFAVLEYGVGREQGYRLFGLEKDLGYFRANATPADDFMLLLCSKVQVRLLDSQTGERLKAKLLRESWNPDYFK